MKATKAHMRYTKQRAIGLYPDEEARLQKCMAATNQNANDVIRQALIHYDRYIVGVKGKEFDLALDAVQ